MNRISIEDLQKMTKSDYLCTQAISIKDEVFGDDKEHLLEFDVFDGFAYCPDYNGKEVWMDFPKKGFIDDAKDMEEAIRKYTQLSDDQEVTETEIMVSYNTTHINE